MTNRQYSMARLLSEAQTIARRIDRPRADFITIEGSKTVAADIELNKYLIRVPRRTDSDLDLAALAGALQSASLPCPMPTPRFSVPSA